MRKLIILFPLLLCACFEDQWQQQDNCKLIQKFFRGSTLKTNSVPSVTSKGQFAVGVVTTGETEQHITIWECEKLGTITSTSNELYRLGRHQETLIIAKDWTGDVVIRKVVQ